ncbi:hypothetical protein HanRHA438_Chr15g0698421 [Helianthus annuus]|nr:hypothetical protein HanRHA438_Chr15g0698421 [Helianthus annuus]
MLSCCLNLFGKSVGGPSQAAATRVEPTAAAAPPPAAVAHSTIVVNSRRRTAFDSSLSVLSSRHHLTAVVVVVRPSKGGRVVWECVKDEGRGWSRRRREAGCLSCADTG